MFEEGVNEEVIVHSPPTAILTAPELLTQSAELFTASLKFVVSGFESVRLDATVPVASRVKVLGTLVLGTPVLGAQACAAAR